MVKVLRKGGIALLILLMATVAIGCSQPLADAGWAAFNVAESTIYVGLPDGKLTALDASTGSKRWEFPADKNRLAGFYGAPVLAGDRLIFGAADPTSSNGVVYSVAAASGQESKTLVTAKDLIVGSPTVSGNTLYVTSADNNLYAIDLNSAQPLWQFRAGGPLWGSVIAANGRLYFGSMEHAVYALSNNGQKIWTFKTEGAVPGTPALSEGVLYVGDLASKVYALDATSGQPVWEKPFKAGNWIWGTPVLAGGILYVPSLDGKVYALDAKTGQERTEWTIKTNGGVRAGPTLAGNVLYVASEDQSLYAVDLTTHTIQWTAKTNGALQTSPVVVGDQVYVTTAAGNVWAVDRNTGGARVLYPQPS